MWEEPVLSGEKGSGTIFFSSCSLRCVFCQNIQISREAVGENLSIEQLGDCMLELQAQGVHNINFVTPGHYILHIREALQKIRGRDLTIPVVYNSSGYERPESLSLLKGLIDIYLPDFKYMSPALSERYSNARDYSQVAKTAHCGYGGSGGGASPEPGGLYGPGRHGAPSRLARPGDRLEADS